ncbi:MAG: GNAT family protein [Pseudomonadota bacterium]
MMLDDVALRGGAGALVPLSHEHGDALAQAAGEGGLWKLWYTSVPAPDRIDAEISHRLELHAAGKMRPFTILDSNGTPVGMTTYCNVEPATPRLEIGYTWYAKRVQRTALNTECKLLLLSRAFDDLDCLAVEFRTSFFNRQSRRAIERLGAKLDGVLRSHRQLEDGSLRDTCVYSIIRPEWPAVRRHLSFLLEQAAKQSGS